MSMSEEKKINFLLLTFLVKSKIKKYVQFFYCFFCFLFFFCVCERDLTSNDKT